MRCSSILFVIAAVTLPQKIDTFLGFNFGLDLAVNPLSVTEAAALLASRCPVAHAKLFNYRADYLTALRDAGFQHVVVSLPNKHLSDTNAPSALARVLAPFAAAGMHLTVAVGNEPLASWYGGKYDSLLVGALRNVRAALDARGLSGVRVTVPFQFGVLGQSYPPSAGSFASAHAAVIRDVATTLARDGSSFYINIYPFFAHRSDAKSVPLAYALGEDGAARAYPSLLHAQLAAVRSALIRLDSSFTEQALPIVIGETGGRTVC